MNKNKRIIYCLFLLLSVVGLIAIFLFHRVYLADKSSVLTVEENIANDLMIDSFVIHAEYGKKEAKIEIWKKENGIYYAFLPSEVRGLKLTIQLKTDQEITIDDTSLRNGTKVSDFEKDKTHEVYVDNQRAGSIVFVQSSNLPAMYITTKSGSMEQLKQDKNYQESAKMILADERGNVEYSGKLDWISGRGNHTWTLDKKGWGIKLGQQASLLGMSPSKKWVLFANAYDDSDGLRNYIAYNMGIDSGIDYSPEMRFIDLYLNGEYAGTYQLVERLQINGSHIDAGKFTKNNNTGGYLLERNYGSKLKIKGNSFTTNQEHDQELGFVIRGPEDLTKDDIAYIREVMIGAEEALFSADYINSKGEKLSDLIDMESWAVQYLIDEITKNEGAGSTSAYFHKKKNDPKIYAGPLWDYDKSLGREEIWQDPEGLFYSSMHSHSTQYYAKFYRNEEAQRLIKDLYINTFRSIIADNIDSLIDEYTYLIKDSFNMNWIRWEDSLIKYDYTLPKELADSYGHLEESAKYIKQWLSKRMDFLDRVWIENEEYFYVKYVNSNGGSEVLYVKPNEAVINSAMSETVEPLFDEEWYYAGTDNRFDPADQIIDDVILVRDPVIENSAPHADTDAFQEGSEVGSGMTIIGLIRSNLKIALCSVMFVALCFSVIVMAFIDKNKRKK